MIVSIAQPAYLPWPGYFDRIRRSDVHVVLDSVRLQRGSRDRFTNRNRIRTPDGSMWLTVPVLNAGSQPVIAAAAIDRSQRWQSRHWNALVTNYSSSPHFREHAGWFEAFYREPWSDLAEMIEVATAYLLDAVGVRTPRLRSSSLAVTGTKSDYILALCREVCADRYLSGPFGRDYLDHAAFDRAGIAIEYHDVPRIDYPQAFPGFVPDLSIVDLIFNCGPRADLTS